MRFRLTWISTGLKNKATIYKTVIVIVILLLIYILLDFVQYVVKKISKDQSYFENTYRQRRLDQHHIWDDRILSPREAAVTEEKPPDVILI